MAMKGLLYSPLIALMLSLCGCASDASKKTGTETALASTTSQDASAYLKLRKVSDPNCNQDGQGGQRDVVVNTHLDKVILFDVRSDNSGDRVLDAHVGPQQRVTLGCIASAGKPSNRRLVNIRYEGESAKPVNGCEDPENPGKVIPEGSRACITCYIDGTGHWYDAKTCRNGDFFPESPAGPCGVPSYQSCVQGLK